MNMQYSPAGLAMTKQFEGLRLTAYRDGAGVLTVGYGHTGKDVTVGEEIDIETAEALLWHDLIAPVMFVNRAVKVALTQGQFDALVDFAFNLGTGTLERSTLLKDVNAGDFFLAATQFPLWVNAGGKPEPGLVKRRAAERAMFEEKA